MTGPVLLVPLRVEAVALRGLPVARTGMGPARTARAVAALRRPSAALVAGVAGGVDPGIRPGDLVVADEVRGAGVAVPVPSAPLLAGTLARAGLTVHTGPVASTDRLTAGRPRAGAGVLAVDMESAAAALACRGVPFAVVRAVVDTADLPLLRPGTVPRGIAALRALHRAAPVLAAWLAATGPRDVVLAEPGSVPGATERLAAVAAEVDLLLVCSGPAAGSRRLVEVGERAGAASHVVGAARDVDLAWLAGARRVALAADASAPPHLVEDLVQSLRGLAPAHAGQPAVTAHEDVPVTLPRRSSPT